jgi:hypothetical protein
MSQPSPEVRAVVRAADAMTTQLRRIADALSTPTAIIRDGVTTPLDDAPTTTAGLGDALPTAPRCVCGEPIELRGDPPHWIHSPGSDTHCLDARPAPAAQKLAHFVPAEAYAVWTEQTPVADEDALRTTRRDQLGVLLSRAGRGVLTTDEAALLRQHVEAEMRDADQARATINRMRRTNRMVNGGARDSRERAERAEAAAEEQRRRADLAETELRTLRAGLRANGADPTQIQNLWAQIRLRNRQWRDAKRERDEAEAAIERVRRVCADPVHGYTVHRSDVLAALDGTEQPTTEG